MTCRWALPALAGALALAGAPSWAQQHCDTRMHPLSSPTSRFNDNADGTVTDGASKLMWMRCSLGQAWAGSSCSGPPARHTWQTAQAAADDFNLHSPFNDWHLPTVRELATIAERECSDPRINLAVFPDTAAAAYWTQSSRRGDVAAEFAYALSFGRDGIVYFPKQDGQYVRLVRRVP